MVKKLLLVLCLLLLPNLSRAEDFHLSDTILDTLNKIPELKNGGYYSFLDNGFNYSIQTTIIQDVVGVKGLSINAGAAGDRDRTDWKAIASIGYDLGRLQDYGVKVPIVKYVGLEPYICTGFGKLNFREPKESEFDFGIGVNVMKVKF